MYHHSNTVLFEPKKCLVQSFFQARTFYRFWFVKDSLIEPYEEEWYEYTGYYKTSWYCVTSKFERYRSIVTVESSLNVWKNSDFNKYKPQSNWKLKQMFLLLLNAEWSLFRVVLANLTKVFFSSKKKSKKHKDKIELLENTEKIWKIINLLFVM